MNLVLKFTAYKTISNGDFTLINEKWNLVHHLRSVPLTVSADALVRQIPQVSQFKIKFIYISCISKTDELLTLSLSLGHCRAPCWIVVKTSLTLKSFCTWSSLLEKYRITYKHITFRMLLSPTHKQYHHHLHIQTQKFQLNFSTLQEESSNYIWCLINCTGYIHQIRYYKFRYWIKAHLEHLLGRNKKAMKNLNLNSWPTQNSIQLLSAHSSQAVMYYNTMLNVPDC